MKYQVLDVFDSVVNEGVHIGTPCTFIRLSGCNLKCPWCNSKESWLDEATPMDEKEIFSQITKKTVVITGGEPTIYRLTPLVKKLKRAGIYIILETNGMEEITENDYEFIDWISVSPKEQSDYLINITPNEIKLICDRYFYKNHTTVLSKVKNYPVPIWIIPEQFSIEKSFKQTMEIIKKMTHGQVKLGVQLNVVYKLR